jgi:hypothetical protein
MGVVSAPALRIGFAGADFVGGGGGAGLFVAIVVSLELVGALVREDLELGGGGGGGVRGGGGGGGRVASLLASSPIVSAASIYPGRVGVDRIEGGGRQDRGGGRRRIEGGGRGQ